MYIDFINRGIYSNLKCMNYIEREKVEDRIIKAAF